jgi:hypothetical protein
MIAIAIETKYIGPTITRGSRIKATSNTGSILIPYPQECSHRAAHLLAAKTLLRKLNFVPGVIHSAPAVKSSGYVVVVVVEGSNVAE